MGRLLLLLAVSVSLAVGLSACTVVSPTEVVKIDISTCLDQTYVAKVGTPYDACRASDDLPNPRELRGCFVWQDDLNSESLLLNWRNGWVLSSNESGPLRLTDSPQLRMSFFVGQPWFACSGLTPESECSISRGCLVKLTNGQFDADDQSTATFGREPSECSVISNLPISFAECVECDGDDCVTSPPEDSGTGGTAGMDASIPICGNGEVERGEECDEGESISSQCEYGQTECLVCNPMCQLVNGETSFCGDGQLDERETCDDGNQNTEVCDYGELECEVCDARCQLNQGQRRYCGDSIVDENEECDEGQLNGRDCDYGEFSCAICTVDCRLGQGVTSFCGDGTVDEAYEACESNETNTQCSYGDTACTVCNERCRLNPGVSRYCGNGNVEESHETCDDGNAETESCPYNYLSCAVCDDTCQTVAGPIERCGDNVLDANEECDDGNRLLEKCDPSGGISNCIVCGPDCRQVPGATAVCGDGVVDAGEPCELQPNPNLVTSLLWYMCGSRCRWLDQAGARDVAGITNLPLTLKARLSVPSDPSPGDSATVDLDWWVLYYPSYVEEPMTVLTNVATVQSRDRPWMGYSTIEERGNDLAIIFREGHSLCSPRHNRTLIGIRATDLSIAGDGTIHPTDVHVTLEQSLDEREPSRKIVLFERNFRMIEPRQFAVIGLISLCGSAGREASLTFTGFEGNSFIDFDPGHPESN